MVNPLFLNADDPRREVGSMKKVRSCKCVKLRTEFKHHFCFEEQPFKQVLSVNYRDLYQTFKHGKKQIQN